MSRIRPRPRSRACSEWSGAARERASRHRPSAVRSSPRGPESIQAPRRARPRCPAAQPLLRRSARRSPNRPASSARGAWTRSASGGPPERRSGARRTSRRVGLRRRTRRPRSRTRAIQGSGRSSPRGSLRARTPICRGGRGCGRPPSRRGALPRRVKPERQRQSPSSNSLPGSGSFLVLPSWLRWQ